MPIVLCTAISGAVLLTSSEMKAGECVLTRPAVAGVPKLLEPRVAAHIERGRVAMRRLEEMFAKQPSLQNQDVSTTSTIINNLKSMDP